MALVLPTSVLVTNGNKKVVKVPYIHYLVWFQEEQIKILLNNGSEVNAINPIFVRKLGLKIWKTKVRAQKINGSTLETFGMIIAEFQVKDKASRHKFFQEIFLITDTKFEVILRIFFLKISNIDVSFSEIILI